MGIAERSYIRDNGGRSGGGGIGRGSFGHGRLSVVGWLIIINIAVFLIDLVLPTAKLTDYREVVVGATQEQIARAVAVEVPIEAEPPMGVAVRVPLVDPVTGQQVGNEIYRRWHLLNGYGHFSLLKGFLQLEVWRVVTYQFLHANASHIFFNMFGLFMFGGMVEQYLGRKQFLSYYLLCGISGGLMYLIIVGLAALGVPLPGTLSSTSTGTPLIGASAGVFGVIIACAKISPNQSVMLIFPPIPLKLKWLAYGYVVIAAGNLILGGTNAGGDAAHVGGAIAGYFFIRRVHLLRGFLDFGIGPAPKHGGGHPKPLAPRGSRLQMKADQILDKVQKHGMQSLTEREKKILNKSARESGGHR
ncbi:MAG: rhomboid family intramembrane serine protease [Phycisphaerales bacterium]|nr:rhomboid family intramembrane serine protease [Phycisphaerales bacterium]MCB9836352.1 rhomboid family intramembrane serine protease [Phycisphaera sp.]